MSAAAFVQTAAWWSAPAGEAGTRHSVAADQLTLIELALASIGALITAVIVAGPLHAPLRCALQPLITHHVQQQLAWVAWVQCACHRLLDPLVAASAVTVTVEFNISALPVLVWCGYPGIVLRLLCVLAFSGYVCFAAKDLLCAPRPGEVVAPHASKVSIAVRDQTSDIEGGAPSAHCALSVPILAHSVELAARAGLLPQPLVGPLSLACFAWVAWVAWGRLYLGVHSPLDLGAGTLLGFSLLSLWRLVDDAALAALGAAAAAAPGAAAAALLAASFAALRAYPAAERFTHCFNHTTAWVGAWCGGMLAAVACRESLLEGASGAAAYARAAPRGTTAPAAAAAALTPGAAALLGAKLLLGLTLVVAAKVGVRAATLAALPRLLRAAPAGLRRAWRPPISVAAAAGARRSAAAPAAPASAGAADADTDACVGCRPDGVPWDADALSRFTSYCCAVAAVFLFHVWWDSVLLPAAAFGAVRAEL